MCKSFLVQKPLCVKTCLCKSSVCKVPLCKGFSQKHLRCLGSCFVYFTAWGERYGSDDRVDGREAVGNSLGGPVGGSEMEVWTCWTDGKPVGIAWAGNRGK